MELIINNSQYCSFIYWFEHHPTNLNNSKKIYVKIDTLFNQISSDIQTYNIDQSPTGTEECDTNNVERSSPPMTIYNSSIKQNFAKYLNQESLDFLLFQIMHDIIVEISHDQEAFNEFICECRDTFRDNATTLADIESLKYSYDASKAINLYTQPSFLFRIISRAYRSENIECVYRCRKYIADLHRDLEKHYKLQGDSIRPTVVHRGKKLSLAIIQQLIDHQGSLTSMNGFLSTTVDYQVAVAFSSGGTINNGFGNVIYEMHTDENISRPFASIKDISHFKDEEEVLFSAGSIWKIESVKHDNNIWRVVLHSCNKNNLKLKELKNSLIHGSSLLSIGDILRKQGDLAKAERFYKRMLEDSSLSEEKKGFLYHSLGLLYLERDQIDDAVKYLQMALTLIDNQSVENNNISLSFYLYTANDRLSPIKILYNIGLMYQNNRDYDTAAQWYNKALNQSEIIISNLEKASIYYNLGRLFVCNGSYEEAFKHYKKAVGFADGHPENETFKKALLTIDKYLKEQQQRNINATI
ncbi:unnamed protein product [Adineta steineri]|uniref:NAD(P)(+)--arginine ADP-ribosyltransferase n=2 Tax=Adineta steineri TaxID=433720 RepID=A0A815UVK9_9BILA|nr:unnamed protein product [Adineta steineri]CAF4154663.1 unnamed protein product [Adineta steineri]